MVLTAINVFTILKRTQVLLISPKNEKDANGLEIKGYTDISQVADKSLASQSNKPSSPDVCLSLC